MNARERFAVNDAVRVRVAVHSVRGAPVYATLTGIVRGFPKSPAHVRIQVDGRRSVATYPIAHVEKADAAPRPPRTRT